MGNGWIQLHRKLRDCWVWENPLYLKAWIDILYSANYADKKILFDGEVITVKRGQFITSLRKLAVSWDCNVKTVRRILGFMKEQEMVTVSTTGKGTLLTVINYDFYQFQGTPEGTPNGTQDGTLMGTLMGTPDGTQDGTLMGPNIINKEYEKEKKGKKEKIDKSPFPPFDLEALLEEYTWTDSMKDTVRDWFTYKKERREAYKEQGAKSQLKIVDRYISEYGEPPVKDQILNAMGSGYRGMILDRLDQKPKQKTMTGHQENIDKWRAVLDELAGNNEIIDADGFDVSELEPEGPESSGTDLA